MSLKTQNPDKTPDYVAASLTRIEERRALIREALRALIERESALRLARLGGSQPDLKPTPRRRSARAG